MASAIAQAAGAPAATASPPLPVTENRTLPPSGRLMMAVITIAGAVIVGIVTWEWVIRDPPRLRFCQYAILETLKAPATYKRVQAITTDSEELLIQFDAANAYGTPIRGYASCRFGAEDSTGTPSLASLVVDGRRYVAGDLLVYDTLARAKFQGLR